LKCQLALLGGGDSNLYGYMLGDPVNLVDLLGLWAGIDDAIFTFGGAVIGVVGQGLSDLFS